MARGTSYQAGSVNVSLNANSAQYVQALQKAKQVTNSCLSNMSQTFKHFASSAVQAGATIGRVTSAIGGPVVKSTMLGIGAITTYTGVVIAHRLEQQKLAVQYGVTAEQMNQVAYMANYAGIEAEDLLDAMKEISIKAGDATEAGGKVTNTMTAFYKAAGGAGMWEKETNPVTKINNLRIAFQKLSDSDKIRVLDEMGDAGLRANGILRLTNEEFEMLQKTGAATATAANMTAIQTLIAKFGYLQQIGNDFLMGIVGRIAPVLIKVVEQWTNKLRSAFEDKGGFKEGFQSYVDLWAKRIFDFLMDTIESVASFVDSLRNLSNSLVVGFNNTKAVASTVFDVGAESKTFSNSSLNDKERAEFAAMESRYNQNEKNSAIYNSTRAQIEKIENDIGKDKAQSDARYIALVKDMNAAEKRVNEYTASGELERYKSTVHVYNAREQADRNPNAAKDAVAPLVASARQDFKETMKHKPADDSGVNHKKGKGLTEQVYAASQTGDGGKANENWEAYKKKLQAQREEVQQIMKKYNADEISEVERREQEEAKTLNDAYKGMKDIVTDYYADKLKTLTKNSPAYVKATKEMNDRVKAIEEERIKSVDQLEQTQHKRRITDLNEMSKDIERKRKDIERRHGFGEASKENPIDRERTEISDEYDQMLEEMRDKYGKHLDDQNSEEYRKFKELQDMKQRALEEYDQEVMDRFWSNMTEQQTIGNLFAQTKGKGQSPFPGLSNDDVQNAKTNADAQKMIAFGAADQMLDKAAKNDKKAFAAKKAMNIAAATMAMFTGAAEALKWGFPLGPIFAAMVVGMGLMNINSIRQQQWTGQAHDGIDYVPNEGTWNLQKGERVLGPALNQDMTQFLKANKDNNFSGRGSVTNHYTTNVQGNVLTNSEYEAGLLERNAPYMYALNEQYRQDRGL
ncbi:hypothetical protein [Aeromonas veronii]|uniref:hypothetical protein n=1 Tax=Aeromonas veronii TaxID=654 RepID=UPI003BA0BBEC